MQAVTSDDIYSHRNRQDLSASPRRFRAVYVRSRARRDQGGLQATAWLIDTSPDCGHRARQLTSARFSARSLAVDPRGERMAFLSEREPGTGQQIQLIRLDGGEARALTHAQPEISTLLGWSEDSSRSLAIQSMPRKEDEHDDPEAPSRPLVVRCLPYRMDGAGYKIGSRKRLVEIDAESGDVRAGRRRLQHRRCRAVARRLDAGVFALP